MKRVTHWQAAFAVCLSLAVAWGSLWLFNYFVVTPQIIRWMNDWHRNPASIQFPPLTPLLGYASLNEGLQGTEINRHPGEGYPSPAHRHQCHPPPSSFTTIVGAPFNRMLSTPIGPKSDG